MFSIKLPSTTSSLSSKYLNFNLSSVSYPLPQLFLVLTFSLNLLLKLIFSVQNSNLMYSVDFSPDLVQTQVRETVSGTFLAQMDVPIQVWHMVEVMRKGFQRTSYNPSTHHRKPTWNLANDGRSACTCGNELPRDS